MKLKHWLVPASASLLFFLLMLTFRPVPKATSTNSKTISGIVSNIQEVGTNDIQIRLEDNQQLYYINRGLESGLSLEQLQQELVGQVVSIEFPEYWTPLDPNNSMRHISKLYTEQQVIFSEL